MVEQMSQFFKIPVNPLMSLDSFQCIFLSTNEFPRNMLPSHVLPPALDDIYGYRK